MPKLNKDVLFLILKELQSDKRSLLSCLLVNKSWCEIIVPILWKNPWIYLRSLNYKLLSNVIISYLSNETKEYLRIQGYNLPEIRQKPLFNYIGFCRHLKLLDLERIIIYNIEASEYSIIMNEILKLFINRNTRITHLYIPSQFNYQIHLIPGAEHCFSKLRFLQCRPNINQNIFEGLIRMSKSIKNLLLNTYFSYIYPAAGYVKLIEAQKNLSNVCFTGCVTAIGDSMSFYKTLEESLIKHADTIKYLQISWVPITKFLSYLVNLLSLEVKGVHPPHYNNRHHLSLPALKILETKFVPSKSLASLIENTKGHLTEISIDYLYYEKYDDNKGHIQAIYQNCPNLKYLKLLLKNRDISEIEKLLIHCQLLDGLVIKSRFIEEDWNSLFIILTKSSPVSLFKFKFYSSYDADPKLDSMKLFLDSWKGKHPMLLQTTQDISHVIKEYIVEGTVKKYDQNEMHGDKFEDFEWIQKKW